MRTPSAPKWLTINFPRDLSFAKSVGLQERVRPSLAVTSFTALPISAASCNSCMRPVFVTDCDRSSMSSSQIGSKKYVPQCLDQLKQQTSHPKAALETTCQNAGCATSDDVAVIRCQLEDISVICVSTSPKPDISSWYPLATSCGISKCAFYAVIEFPHVPNNTVVTPAARATWALSAELPLERRVPLNSKLDIPLTDVC